MQVDTLRPISVIAAGGWTAQPSGTLNGVTSDDSDASYALSSTATAFSLGVFAHTPASGHQRHMVRARMRGRVTTGTGSVGFRPLTPAGAEAVNNIVPLTETPTDFLGSWSADAAFNLAAMGALSLGVGAGSVGGTGPPSPIDGVRVQELYVDVDTRAAPTFTPQILDGSGVDQAGGTVTDTNLIRTAYIDENYDGLTVRSWRVAIYTLAQTLAVGFEPFVTTPESSAGDNGAPQMVMHILSNDDYVAYFELSSNIRAGDAFPSEIVVVPFTVDAAIPFGPVNVTITPTLDPPSITLCWDALETPGEPPPWADPEGVYAQIERTDCNGTEVIALIPDGLTGCYTDRFMSLSRMGTFCDDEDHVCEVCYRIRYWGIVDALQDFDPAIWDTDLWDTGVWGF